MFYLSVLLDLGLDNHRESEVSTGAATVNIGVWIATATSKE